MVGLGSTSSGRSILVAPTASPAIRVCTATCSGVIPSTWETALPSAFTVMRGIHVPVPSNAPSDGRAPEPSISEAGELPENVAT